MCGIVGFTGTLASINNDLSNDIIRSIRHRGPDADGLWHELDKSIWLAHLRLSIIDLSPLAAQPMISPDGRYVLVFNGEIYNFKILRSKLVEAGYLFHSQSDTEVVLHGFSHWGIKLPQKLEGMFAFAVYDTQKKQLFLSRDRAGEKPLYYYLQSGDFAFASELKALLAHPLLPRKINGQAFDHLLAYGFTASNQCILDGYAKLPPAHSMQIDVGTGQFQIWQYWSPPSWDGVNRSREELTKTLEDLLTHSVNRQLVADVPVGILLSGGVDSSLLTAIAAKSNSGIYTYTVSFPGTGAMDEAPYARQIADYFGTNHTVIEAEAPNPNLLKLLAHQYDEPMTDPSMVPTFLLCREVRKYCTVALGGDGGDELFGGYHRYQRMLQLQRQAQWAPLSFRKLGAVFAERMLPQGFKGRNSLMEWGTDFSQQFPIAATLFDFASRQKLFDGQDTTGTAEQTAMMEVMRGINIADTAMRSDLTRYLSEDILVKSDRASMLSSLELRAPFLDTLLLNFAFGQVHPKHKVDRERRKILLQELALKLLPPEYDAGRKQGFVPPVEQWLKEKNWETFFKDNLLFGNNLLFNRKEVETLWVGQKKGRFNKRRLFTLLMITLWQKEYKAHF